MSLILVVYFFIGDRRLVTANTVTQSFGVLEKITLNREFVSPED